MSGNLCSNLALPECQAGELAHADGAALALAAMQQASREDALSFEPSRVYVSDVSCPKSERALGTSDSNPSSKKSHGG